MNEDPLVVIGLDALDYKLAQDWGCDNLLLNNHKQIETFAHTKEWPITAEVWPVIAKGEMPRGQERRRGEGWDGALGIAAKGSKYVLPDGLRSKIGRYLRVGDEVSDHYLPSDGDHMFQNGVVFNWPEITPAQNWSRANYWWRQHLEGDLTDEEFFNSQIGITGEELGWAYAMTKTQVPIIGTRCHSLDYFGHQWCHDTDKLRVAYETVDEMIGEMWDNYDGEIVILSDHGMQVGGIDDSPGEHSWRPTISTTISGDLPTEMDEIRPWVEEHKPVPGSVDWDNQTSGTDRQHLEDLGYL